MQTDQFFGSFDSYAPGRDKAQGRTPQRGVPTNATAFFGYFFFSSFLAAPLFSTLVAVMV